MKRGIVVISLAVILGGIALVMWHQSRLTRASDDFDGRSIASIERERVDTISDLLAVATAGMQRPADRHSYATTAGAIRELGRYHAAEAVPLLAANVTYAPAYVRFGGLVGPRSYFPCVNALIEIGSPALPCVISPMGTADPKMDPYIRASIIENILGREQGVAYIRESISLARDSETSRERRSLLAAAVKHDFVESDKPLDP